MRKQIIAANWKMNLSYNEAVAYITSLVEQSEHFSKDQEIILFIPSIYIREFSKKVSKAQGLFIGGQNIHFENAGAFTGEISGSMIKSVGATYCLVGHSERRSLFHEDDDVIQKKVKAAIAVDLKTILCCGEALSIREAGNYLEFVINQLKSALAPLTVEEFNKIDIAYEPVWAIGTGRTASVDQIAEMHSTIRATLSELFGQNAAEATRILYGGSCNAENAEAIFSTENVDGGLIGGASLKVSTFMPVIKAGH